MKYRCTPNTVVMGSTTAGADGNCSSIILPGNFRATFTGLGVYYPDKSETQQIGILPDIEVKNTIQGICKGRDEVLEAAIKYLNNKMKSSENPLFSKYKVGEQSKVRCWMRVKDEKSIGK